MPSEVMLVLRYPSGVVYFNQVGGVACKEEEIEGVLVPVEMSPASAAKFRSLPWGYGSGISLALADAIDELFSLESRMQFLKVDRARLCSSAEAWVFVTAETQSRSHEPRGTGYLGSVYGFGTVLGVLTWPNSD